MKKVRLASMVFGALVLSGSLTRVQAQDGVSADDELMLELGDEDPPAEEVAPAPVAPPAPVVKKKAAPPPAPPEEEPEVSGSDEPNLSFERRVFQTFKRTGKPMDGARWSELLGERKAESYGIQAGDTLWDISRTFFGDGSFWSKLWAENGVIENPHRIEPGKYIQFIAGNEAEAPSVSVTNEISLNTITSPQMPAPIYRERLAQEGLSPDDEIDDNELLPEPEIPPAKTRPLLKKLPPSFAVNKPTGLGGYDKSGLDSGRRRALLEPAVVYINSYLADRKPAGIGKIEEIEMGEKVASLGQDVFVQLKRAAQIGERLSAVQIKGEVKKPQGSSVGPVIEVSGILEITGVINENKRQYRATVVETVNPVKLGDTLLEEPLPRTTFAATGSRSEAQVQIIGGEFDEERRLFGSSAVIYLDGGERAGLREGDLLAVSARRSSRREETKFPDVRRSIGVIKIVKVMPSVATAVVIEALDEIRPGDRTGGEFPQGARSIHQDVTSELARENPESQSAPQISKSKPEETEELSVDSGDEDSFSEDLNSEEGSDGDLGFEE